MTSRLWRPGAGAFVLAILGACASSTPPQPTPAEQLAAITRELDRLQGEAERLADVSAIKRLQRAYGYYLEAAQWDQMTDLFADSGSIEIAQDGVYVGKEHVRRYLNALGGGHVGLRSGQLSEHFQLQPVIDVAPDGQSAKGRWRALIMSGQFKQNARWGEGTYENEYVKDHGIWKLAKLHWYQTFLVPYEGGWAKNHDLTGGVFVGKKLTPDQPPSEHYGVWPAVYIPPFHYKNPAPSGEAAQPALPAGASGSLGELEKAVASLKERIERLKDADEVENLVSMYGYYLDKQQWDLLTDLFAPDGSMEISQRGIYKGHAGVRRALELFGPQNIEPEHLHNHIQIQPVIQVAADGTRAWTRSRALSELGTYQRVGIWGDGVYENEYVKVNGVWKIYKDHVYTTFFATYDKGWENGAGKSPKASPKIPPDAPPSEIYESFPDIYVPPFHYKHPVTGQPIKWTPGGAP
ncbi:MAG TPA: nuclear transport factor 2 family protein [Steroidobacteraceae bacterium]|nr:nuclear transport factor 2 family protein [Steroidobacteraceae bacterium]